MANVKSSSRKTDVKRGERRKSPRLADLSTERKAITVKGGVRGGKTIA